MGVTIFERRAHYRLILTVLTLIWDRSMSFFYANVYRAFSRRLKSLRSVMKIFAARIGPTVWDEDGPTGRKESEDEKERKARRTSDTEEVEGGYDCMFCCLVYVAPGKG